MKRALLFDIDGTLVDTGGAGRRAMTRAFEDLFHIDDPFRGDKFSGKTDPIIFHKAARRHFGREPTREEEGALKARYLEYLETEVAATEDYRVLPGVEDLLEALSNRPDCVTGLCTGNFREGAAIKLARGGIDRYFGFGGFGSDSGDRPELTRMAGVRASDTAGGPVSPVVIGDSPLDYHAARANGFTVALVGTGWTDPGELRGLRPDFYFESLADTEAVAALLLGIEGGFRSTVDEVDRAARVVREGGVIVHPTSTLFGLGGDAALPRVSDRFRSIKGGRQSPFIVLVSGVEHASSLVREMPSEALALADRFWPGPLTLVMEAGNGAPRHLLAEDGTIALRVDDHPFVQNLLEASGCALLSTSANRTGAPPPGEASEVDRVVTVSCDLFVTGGKPALGRPSTVVRVTGDGTDVLREGAAIVDLAIPSR